MSEICCQNVIKYLRQTVNIVWVEVLVNVLADYLNKKDYLNKITIHIKRGKL